jgi:hypothetical protein
VATREGRTEAGVSGCWGCSKDCSLGSYYWGSCLRSKATATSKRAGNVGGTTRATEEVEVEAELGMLKGLLLGVVLLGFLPS